MTDRNEGRASLIPPYMGMNSYNPPHHMPEGMGVSAYNVKASAPYSICKRGGFSYLNTASYAIPKVNTGTIMSMCGAIVYGSGTNWTNTISANDCFFIKGNSSPVFWKIAGVIGSQTMTLAVAYTQTVTAGSYIISPAQVDGLFRYKYGTVQKLMAQAGSDIYTYGSGQFTKTSAALTPGFHGAGVTFQDKFVFANGYQFKYYDGTSGLWSAFSGSPDPTLPLYLGVYTIGNADFLVAMGSLASGSESAIAFTDVDSLDTWPAANKYFVGDRDGSKITGGGPIPGGWCILKDSAIYVFGGIPGSGTLRKIIDNLGCIAPGTVKAHENWLYFLGRRAGFPGLYRFNGSTLEKLSKSVSPTLEALDQEEIKYAVGEIRGDVYRLSLRSAGGTANDLHFDCYYSRPSGNGYYPWFTGNRGVNALLSYEEGDTNELYSGSTTNGMVIVEESGNSDDITDNTYNTTAAITGYGETGWMDFGDNSKKKELLRLFIDATESGNWNLVFKIYQDWQTYGSDDYTVNLGSSTNLWSEVVYGSTPWQGAVDKSVTEVVLRYPKLARFWKFRWSNENSGEPFEVFPATIYYKRESI